MYLAKIYTHLRKSILDPQGQTTLHALKNMGYEKAEDLRIGKFFELTIDSNSKEDAEKQAHEICDKLLCNPVMEDYTLELSECQPS